MEWTADFETNASEETCALNPVWAWGIVDVYDDSSYIHGSSIESFIAHLSKIEGRVWFHNLKFDGKFIIDYLIRNGCEHVDNAPKMGQFSTLIDEGGRFYQLQINLTGKIIKIADSLKKVTMSLRDAAKTFDLDMSKGEIDYTIYRPKGHVLTAEEADYLKRDVLILAHVMRIRLTRGDKLTTGSDCLASYKDLLGKYAYMSNFPKLSNLMDTHLRASYKGGYVYVNPLYQNKVLNEKCASYDVNSMYPYIMRTKALPYGIPEYRTNVLDYDGLWIAHMSLSATLKEGRLPCIQIKNDARFNPREYVSDTGGYIDMWVTSVDYRLIKLMYDIDVEQVYGGYCFNSRVGMFNDYIDFNMQGKIDAKNPGERYNYKLYLTNLYGKFGQKIEGKKKVPRLIDDEVHYITIDDKPREPVYTAIASFVTAYAREYLLTNALNFGDRFIYSDTDSIKVIGTDTPDNMFIDDTELGAFKQEYVFDKSIFIRPKTYAVRLLDGSYIYKCAGMPVGLKKVMQFDDFRIGFTNDVTINPSVNPIYLNEECMRLIPKDVKGGVVLVPTPFTLRK